MPRSAKPTDEAAQPGSTETPVIKAPKVKAAPPPVAGPRAALPPVGAPDVLYLVDLSGYVFRAYHAIAPLSSPTGELTHAVHGTVAMLNLLVEERKPAYLAIAMDASRKTFRSDIDARYKATRPPTPDDLVSQMRRIRQIVDAYGIPVFCEDGLEADDLIAALASLARARGLRVVIATADKDLMQLVEGTDVVLWDTMRSKVYGATEVEEKFGVGPSAMRDLLALVGDTSDNVPGVPGVGPKTAADLLKSYGTLDGVFAHLDEIKRPKLQESLRAHEADARISQQLVTLHRDGVRDLDLEKARYGGADLERLREIFTELGFTRYLRVLPMLPANPKASGSSPPGPLASTRLTSSTSLTPSAEVGASANVARPASPLGATEASGPAVPPPIAWPDARVLLDVAALDAFVGDVEAAGHVAVEVFATGAEPMTAHLVGFALAYGAPTSSPPDGALAAPIAAAGVSAYVPLGHRYLGAPAQLSWEAAKPALARLFENEAIAKIGYDLKFVDVLLRTLGVRLRGQALDAMLAAYLLDPEAENTVAAIAMRELRQTLPVLEDKPVKRGVPKSQRDERSLEEATPVVTSIARLGVDLAPRLEHRMRALAVDHLLRDLEQPLALVLADMEERGVLVDHGALDVIGREMSGALEALELRAKELVGEVNLASPKQLEAVLFDRLKLKAIKKTKSGRSTDVEALEAIAGDHPLPEIVLEHRAIAKLKGTYVDALPRLVHPRTGRIHTRWGQAVAATGRLSSQDPNLQNVPIRTPLGKSIRRAFVAPPGKVIVSADYSQIELRVLAHLSRDPVMLDAFNLAQDIHVRTAMEIFGVAQDGVTEEMRRRSKTVNFGVIYGMGEVALAKRLRIPRVEAANFIEAYFERYAGVRAFMEGTLAGARKSEQVRTLLGRVRHLPDLRSSDNMRRSQAERIAQNTPIQGTAADILKLAMVRLREPVVPGASLVLTVHDELVFEVPAEAAEEAKAKIRETMQTAMPLDVPLVVDAGAGVSWAEAH